MREILVVQWARLGDLLQTRALLDRIRRAYPQARIALSYDARYKDVVALFPEVDEQRPIDVKTVVDLARVETSWPDAIGELLNAGQAKLFDEVLNLTNHASAAWYAHFLSRSRVKGYRIEVDRLKVDDELVRLRNTSDQFRAPCHIADVWSMLLDSTLPARIPRSLHNSADDARFDVALVADAGSPERSLTSRALCVWSECLHERCQGNIYWTGVMNTSMRSAPPYVVDLRGKTMLSSLIDTLARCALVIGPDTGALHLAAALNCEVVGVYLSRAKPERTGPYALESRCVVCDSLNEEVIEDVGAMLKSSGKRHPERMSLRVFRPSLVAAGIEYTSENVNLTKASVDPALSIVIPEFAQTHYVDNLLIEINTSNVLPRYEIIVCSSGLCAEDDDHARNRSGVRTLVPNTPLTFSEACNLGAKSATGSWVLFLNDDTKFDPDAINELWNHRNENAILAPKLLYWDGECQSLGYALRDDGVEEYGVNADGTPPESLSGVSAAVMLVSSELFQAIGGFDESFRNGYEDVDFCLRAKQIGILSRCIRSAQIVHYRGSSPERYDNDGRNEQLLLDRWRHASTPRVGRVRSPMPARLLFLSSCRDAEAGPQSRWLDPLRRIGVDESDFCWFSTREDYSNSALLEALSVAECVVVFRGVESSIILDELIRWKSSSRGFMALDADDQILNRFNRESVRSAARREIESEFEQLQEIADICCAPSTRLLELHRVPLVKRHVLPPTPVSAHFQKRRVSIRDGIIRIGFAASLAHRTDFAQVAPALERFLNEHQDTMLYWWDCHPGELAHHPQVRHGGPWLRDYKSHVKRLQRVPVDFWIVPLSDSVHNSVRSPIRAYEYCGMGAPCIVSNVEPYRSLPSASQLLVRCENNTSAWLAALSSLRSASQHHSDVEGWDPMTEHMLQSHEDLSQYRSLIGKLLSKKTKTVLNHEAQHA